MPTLLTLLATSLLLLVLALAAALSLGGPGTPPHMASISAPFANADFSGLPALQTTRARDGSMLAWRGYAPATAERRGSIVLVHGSSANSQSLHPLARHLAADGWHVVALDIRGHGGSGVPGHAAYVGQLEHDLEDLWPVLDLETPRLLAGFSSGGGFALRIAGGDLQSRFDGYLLLSPFLGQDAPTYRPGSGGWVSVGIPRYVALALLNGFGVTHWNHLPVNRFGVDPDVQPPLTSSYDFALSENFRPQQDWQHVIRRTTAPLRVLVGTDDEAFIAGRFEAAFSAGGRDGVVTLVPGTGHTALTIAAPALRAVAAAARQLPQAGLGKL